MSKTPQNQTYFYRITNASKLPKYTNLILSGEEYYGCSPTEVSEGILYNHFTAVAKVHPIKNFSSGIVEDLDSKDLLTPEQATAQRGWLVRDMPSEDDEEVDMDGTLSSDDEHIDYVLTGLARGEVGSLISAGGTGKSLLGLTKGIQMALGKPSYLTDLTKIRRVCYLSLEDKIQGVRNRIRRIARTLKLDGNQKKQVAKNFRVVTKRLIVATDKDNMCPDVVLDLFVGKPTPDLLIVDTARRLNHLNENDSSEMSAFISLLEEIGEELDCSVLMLHHTSKSSTGAKSRGEEVGSEAARGSGAIVDNGRATWYLSKLSKKEAETYGIRENSRHAYVTLDHTKCNAEGAQERKVLKRGDYGILEEEEYVTFDEEEDDTASEGLYSTSSKKKRGAAAWKK